MLTKIEKELNKLMRSRGVDLHTRMGVAIVLATDSNRKLMIQWIKKNPNAGQCEIMRQMDILRPDQPSAAHVAPKSPQSPRKTHKIAMF